MMKISLLIAIAHCAPAVIPTGAPIIGEPRSVDISNERVHKCLDVLKKELEECIEPKKSQTECHSCLDLGVDPLSAWESVSFSVDEVALNVAIYSEAGDTFNSYLCRYDQSGSVTVAHPFEKKCDALKKNSSPVKPEVHSLGYGGESSTDEDAALPTAAPMPMSRSSMPASYDITEEFPQCHQNVILNQGGCGSCWAFAAASAVASRACRQEIENGSGSVTRDASGKRYELSVQFMMSCNAQKYGCKGGWMGAAFNTLAVRGSVKDSDFNYQCGKGSGENHFEDQAKGSCSSSPWGAQCPITNGINPHKWNGVAVGGAYQLPSNNIAMMKSELITKGAFTVAFMIYRDFFSFDFRNVGIYSNISSHTRVGGHGVLLVGYGVKNGIAYWKLQNSWGARWGDNGYFYMRLGNDLCGIESMGIVSADVQVSGDDEPAQNDLVQPENILVV